MLKQPIAGLVLALAVTAPAYADDWSDCAQETDRLRGIQGCTKIIAAGGKAGANLAIAYIDRGNAYYGEGDYDSAIADYDKAIQIKPDYAEPYTGRGSASFAKLDYDSAIADYTKAIELKPDRFENYTSRGLAYLAKGDHDRATDLRVAASMIPATDPRHDQAVQRLALVKKKRHEQEAATSPSSPSRSSGISVADRQSVMPEEDAKPLGELRQSFAE